MFPIDFNTGLIIFLATLLVACSPPLGSELGESMDLATEDAERQAQLEEKYYEPYAHLEDDRKTAEASAYYESKEREAWESDIEDYEDLGEMFASDPSVNQDSGAIDCDDFDFQELAQVFFEGAGGLGNDVFVLDEDIDGIVCERLPSWSPGLEWQPSSTFP